jgi:hypothetical protein
MSLAHKLFLGWAGACVLACSGAPDVQRTAGHPPSVASARNEFSSPQDASKLIVRMGADLVARVTTGDGKMVGDAARDDQGDFFRRLRQQRGDVTVQLSADPKLPESESEALFDELRGAGFTRFERPVQP